MPQKNRISAISKSQSIRQAPTKVPAEPTPRFLLYSLLTPAGAWGKEREIPAAP